MTDREKFEAYFNPVAESMKVHGVHIFEIMQRKDQQWQGWQAALASQQPADDGWIDWTGGECPIHGGALVDVRFRKGNEACGFSAESWFWSHNCANPIIAYRVVKP